MNRLGIIVMVLMSVSLRADDVTLFVTGPGIPPMNNFSALGMKSLETPESTDELRGILEEAYGEDTGDCLTNLTFLGDGLQMSLGIPGGLTPNLVGTTINYSHVLGSSGVGGACGPKGRFAPFPETANLFQGLVRRKAFCPGRCAVWLREGKPTPGCDDGLRTWIADRTGCRVCTYSDPKNLSNYTCE